MALRKILLRVMLAALGLSALGGVWAVMTTGRELVWRVVAAGFCTAIAAALLMATSLLTDRPRARPAGLLGMAAVIVEFLLALLLILDVIPWNSSTRGAEQVLLSALAVILAAPPAMCFIPWAVGGRRSLAAQVAFFSCAAAFAAMMIGTWLPSSAFTSLGGKWWASAAAIGIFGLLAAASMVRAGGFARIWPWAGVLAAVAAGALAIAGIWTDAHSGSALFASVTGLAVIVAHANLALLVPLRGAQRWMRILTISAVVCTSAAVDISVWSGGLNFDDMVARLGTAFGIIASCGTLALLVLAAINRKLQPAAVNTVVTAISLTCPVCGKKQSLAVGGAACSGCGLGIDIRIAEPHCPSCDYLLYGLTSNRCPECGMELTAQPATPVPG